MDLRYRVVGALAVVLLAAVASALRVQSLANEAAAFSQMTVAAYTTALHEAHRKATPVEAVELGHHIRYYELLRARMEGKEPLAVRDAKIGSVLDCVPFELQPSLIDAAPELLGVARKLWEERAQEGWRQDTTCPSGYVGVARPVVAFRGEERLKLVAPRRKVQPPLKGMPLIAGYSYVDSPDWGVPNTTQATYTVLGVGQGALARTPLTPVEDFNDHSINQGWWLDFTEGFGSLISLEAGWIECAYFTFFPSLTIFAFSTPNGYQGGNANLYNTQGGFIQYPGAPPIGAARTSVIFEFEYRRLPNSAGFELRLRPFHLSDNGIYFEFEEWIPVGFYHMSRYPRAPILTTFQTGQEIYMDSNSTQLTAAGKIFGYGADELRLPILNNFTNFGVEIGFRYGNFPVFGPGTNRTGANYVHFYGVPGTNLTDASSSSSAWN